MFGPSSALERSKQRPPQTVVAFFVTCGFEDALAAPAAARPRDEAIAVAKQYAIEHNIPWGSGPILADLVDWYIPDDSEQIVHSPAWYIRTNADRLGGTASRPATKEQGDFPCLAR